MAVLPRIMYSHPVARIKAQIIPYLFDAILLPRKYVIKTPKVALRATGILSVISVALPKSMQNKASVQKNKGGLSKKNSPFNSIVKYSLDKNMLREIVP